MWDARSVERIAPLEVVIPAPGAALSGELGVPVDPFGLVVFAHGSGSGRHSPRNQAVAKVLRRRGLATLLLDLLTQHEERHDAATGELRFNIPLLAERVTAAIDWARGWSDVGQLGMGLFGASTGAAAALVAAAGRRQVVRAVVSRGGRPDLAGAALDAVRAPTLLLVGGDDRSVIPLNEHAAERMHTETRVEIIPGATHLFEEPHALENVAELAADWFLTRLPEATR